MATEFYDPRKYILAPARHVYIDLPEEEAKIVFKDTFGLDPDRFQMIAGVELPEHDNQNAIIIRSNNA